MEPVAARPAETPDTAVFAGRRDPEPKHKRGQVGGQATGRTPWGSRYPPGLFFS